MPSIRLVTATLSCGDYCLGDALGIERKSATDLARSIVDGRLFRQVGSLRQKYRRPLLLVEGLSDGSAVVGVPWPAVRGALVSVSVCFGVPVLRSNDANDSATLIATAARQLCDPLDIPYVRPGYRPRGWRRRALYILQGLPCVGPRRAGALLERFGSVAAVVTADASALADVAGIGDAVARSIRESLGACPGNVGGHAPN
jgi:ERCC4-type nuclease